MLRNCMRSPVWRWVVIVGAMLSQAACASRPSSEVLTPVPAAGLVRTTRVLVASTRTVSPGQSVRFSDSRSTQVHYARFVISIPPGHQSGKIEWPQGYPDPSKTFAVLSSKSLSEAEFLAEAESERRAGEAGVFVHGFNTSFEESLFRTAQMQTDSSFAGTVVLFSWPSQGKLTGYIADRESVLFSRDALVRVVDLLSMKRRLKLTVFAHSMGSMLTIEALRQLRLQGKEEAIRSVDQVILAAPDIDLDLFMKQLEVVGRLNTPVTLLVSKDDKALLAARVLAGDQIRVGALDVSDPRIQDAVRRQALRVIDISQLASSDGVAHDRYAALASVYPQLQSQLDQRNGSAAAQAGTFVLDVAANALTSPFRLAGGALR